MRSRRAFETFIRRRSSSKGRECPARRCERRRRRGRGRSRRRSRRPSRSRCRDAVSRRLGIVDARGDASSREEGRRRTTARSTRCEGGRCWRGRCVERWEREGEASGRRDDEIRGERARGVVGRVGRLARETEDAVDPDVGDARANARDFGVVGGGEGRAFYRDSASWCPYSQKIGCSWRRSGSTTTPNASTCDVTDRSRRVLRPWCRAGRCR